MAAGNPLSLERMQTLFGEDNPPSFGELREALNELKQDLQGRGIECGSGLGFRLQVRQDTAAFVARLWMSVRSAIRVRCWNLALIAYRQPITRGDIEDVRGVVVSSNIIKPCRARLEVRVVGYRDVPGRPLCMPPPKSFGLFQFKSLDELPSLMEIKAFDDLNRELSLAKTPMRALSLLRTTTSPKKKLKRAAPMF